VGDFNGDGLMDVAVGVAPGLGGSGPSGVYVLLGQTNGTLGTPVKVDSSLNPTGLAAGDLNGDGRTDLIVADQGSFAYVGATNQVNGAIHVYLGNANGTFTAAAMPTTSATNYTVAALGDLNGDGKLDLIIAGNVAGTSADTGMPNLYMLLGNGDGTFKAPSVEALGGTDGIGVTSLALADFNKDGHLDVVAGNPSDFTEMFLGQSDGTFFHAFLDLGQQPMAVAATDLNGDGFPELLVGTKGTIGGENLAVFLNANAWTAAGASSASFAVAASSAAGTLAAGQSAQTTITLTPSNGFSGSVSLSCSGLPTGAACGFSPASVTVNGGAATSTLTITTTARTAMNSKGAPFNPLLPGGVVLAGIFLPMALRRRTSHGAHCAVLVVLLLSAAALPGCGGGSSSSSGTGAGSGTSTSSSSGGGSMGTPAGTYKVTITATAGSTTKTTTYTLTVN
jgi:hypothetical protein